MTERGDGPHAAEAERDGLREALAAARGTILDLRSQLADLRATMVILRPIADSAGARTRELQERVTAAETDLAALRAAHDALAKERDWLLGVRDAQSAQLAELTRQAAALAHEHESRAGSAAAAERLARELRWDDGPRSLRMVLPLARLLRRTRRR